jgi:MFS family permease
MTRIGRIARDYREAIASFSPNAKLYLLGQALLWIGTNQVSLLLSLYLKRLGYTEDSIGTVLATRALGSALIALPASFIAARLDLKRLLPIAAVLTAAATVAQSITASGSVIVGSVFLTGAFSTVFQVSSGPFFMRNSGPEERVHLFSLNGALSMGTGVIGSLLGGGLKDLLFVMGGDEIFAYRGGLVVGALFVLAACLPFSRLLGETAPSPKTRTRAERGADRISPGLWIMLILPGFLVGLGAGLTIPWLNLYFKDVFQLGDAAIGAAVAAGQVATFLGMAGGPALARRLGKPWSVFITQALSVPLILVLAWLRNLPLAILAYLLRQALMNMATPIQDIFALELVPPSRMITVNAIKMLAWTGSWTISARLSGYIIYEGGFAPSFTLTAALYGSSSILFWLFFIKRRKRPAS